MTDRREFGLLLALLALLGAGWGLTQPLAKVAVSEGYRHFGLIFWQLVIGTALLGGVVLVRGRPIRLGRPQILMAVLIAFIGTLVTGATSFQAAVHLPAGILSILLSLVPLFALPIAYWLGIDRPGLLRLTGLAMGLAGVALIVGPDAGLPEPGMVAWIPLALVAPALYALEGNLVARFGTAGLDPVSLLFLASAFGTPFAAVLALATGHFIDPRPPWGAPDAALAVSATVHALVYSAYVWLVGRAGSVFAAQVSYLVTGFGVVWAILLLGERYSSWVWAALVLMFAGLALVQPRPPLAALGSPGNDVRRRTRETP
jgi:drug/metabolite transporter (DMT)-like permease